MKQYHAAIFAHFGSAKAQAAWLTEHAIGQSTLDGGPVFSYSTEDESGHRDEVTRLRAGLQRALSSLRSFDGALAEHIESQTSPPH